MKGLKAHTMFTIIPDKVKTPIEIKYKSKREYDFYFQYLRQLKLFNMKDIESLKKRRLFRESFGNLNTLINESNLSSSEAEKLIKEMTNKFQQEQIKPKDMKPLNKENQRFYNWAWSYLKLEREIHEELKSDEYLNLIHFNHDRSETSERHSDILKALHQGEATYDEQHEIINHLNDKWQKFVYPQTNLIKWLDNSNHSQWDWAFEYIKNNKYNNTDIAWLPSSSTDKLNAIIATMDLWEEKDAKELFFHKMKRAWSQKKFRDKSDGKKSYNISMTQTTKKRLDELARHKELKLNDLIELLIREEHELNEL